MIVIYDSALSFLLLEGGLHTLCILIDVLRAHSETKYKILSGVNWTKFSIGALINLLTLLTLTQGYWSTQCYIFQLEREILTDSLAHNCCHCHLEHATVAIVTFTPLVYMNTLFATCSSLGFCAQPSRNFSIPFAPHKTLTFGL